MSALYSFTRATSSYITRLSRARFLVAVFVLAILVRWAATVTVRDVHSGPVRQRDGIEFNVLAWHLANGQGYSLIPGRPTSYRAPGFPLVLAGVYRVFGARYPFVYLSFGVLGAITCVLTYFLARAVTTECCARAASLLAVVYFPFVYFSTVFASETVFAPCLAASMVCMLGHLRTGSWTALAGAALTLGYAALTRPNAILMVPLALAALGWKYGWRQRRLLAKGFSILTGIVILVIAPWVIRNFSAHRRLVLFTTNGGATFRGGNNSQVMHSAQLWGGWVPENDLPALDRLRQTRTETERDALEWRMGWDWIRSHARSVPRLLALKAVRLWLPNYSLQNHLYALVDSVAYLPYLALFVLGARQCFAGRRRRTPEWLVLHSPLLVTVLTGLVFWGASRFRDGNVAVLMVYASLGIRALQLRLAESVRRVPAVSISANVTEVQRYE